MRRPAEADPGTPNGAQPVLGQQRLGKTRRGREPLQHAVEPPWVRTSNTGRMYYALCGAAVYLFASTNFDRKHPRTCRRCLQILDQRRDS